jgi:hypothetical protein
MGWRVRGLEGNLGNEKNLKKINKQVREEKTRKRNR